MTVSFLFAQQPVHGLTLLHALQWLTEHVELDYQQKNCLLQQ